MKTFLSSLIVALFVTASTATMAQTDNQAGRESANKGASYQVSVYPSIEKTKLSVMIVKEKGAAVQVQLCNDKGYTLATQRLAKKDATNHLRFDLSDLEDGQYQVVITDGGVTTVKEINLATKMPVQVDRLISLN